MGDVVLSDAEIQQYFMRGSPTMKSTERLLRSHEELRRRNLRLMATNSTQLQRLSQAERALTELAPERRNTETQDYLRGFLAAVAIYSSLPLKRELDTAIQAAQREMLAQLNNLGG